MKEIKKFPLNTDFNYRHNFIDEKYNLNSYT